jgi:branched-subunit amino acid aminotransferase/4-amino-4-deoxychorismate lyase
MDVGMQIWINDGLVPENEATVSVFDSGFVLGGNSGTGIAWTDWKTPATAFRQLRHLEPAAISEFSPR